MRMKEGVSLTAPNFYESSVQPMSCHGKKNLFWLPIRTTSNLKTDTSRCRDVLMISNGDRALLAVFTTELRGRGQ
jgi:hypothetical protein